jgi:hypothetical protein
MSNSSDNVQYIQFPVPEDTDPFLEPWECFWGLDDLVLNKIIGTVTTEGATPVQTKYYEIEDAGSMEVLGRYVPIFSPYHEYRYGTMDSADSYMQTHLSSEWIISNESGDYVYYKNSADGTIYPPLTNRTIESGDPDAPTIAERLAQLPT